MVIEANFFKNRKHILDEFDFGIDILDIKNSIISNDSLLEI